MAVQTSPTALEGTFQSGVELRFDLIRARTAEHLNITGGEPTLQEMADLFGLSLKQVWRFSKGLALPSAPTAMRIAETLDLAAEDLFKPKDGGQ